MKLILQTLLLALLTFTITSCDNEDDDMGTACAKAVYFQVGGVEACATGTFSLANNAFTALNLIVDGGGGLVITINGAAETTYAIPAGSALYTSSDGEVFVSTEGGLLDVTDNTETMDATFSFDAESSDGTTVSISSGVVVDLPKQ